MKIVRIVTAAGLAQLSLVICAILPAGVLAGASAAGPASAVAHHTVAVNIVEYGPGSP
jgi:hypothetical protein